MNEDELSNGQKATVVGGLWLADGIKLAIKTAAVAGVLKVMGVL